MATPARGSSLGHTSKRRRTDNDTAVAAAAADDEPAAATAPAATRDDPGSFSDFDEENDSASNYVSVGHSHSSDAASSLSRAHAAPTRVGHTTSSSSSQSRTTVITAAAKKTKGAAKGLEWTNQLFIKFLYETIEFLHKIDGTTDDEAFQFYQQAIADDGDGGDVRLLEAYDSLQSLDDVSKRISSTDGLKQLLKEFFQLARDVDNDAMNTKQLNQIRFLLESRRSGSTQSSSQQQKSHQQRQAAPSSASQPLLSATSSNVLEAPSTTSAPVLSERASSPVQQPIAPSSDPAAPPLELPASSVLTSSSAPAVDMLDMRERIHHHLRQADLAMCSLAHLQIQQQQQPQQEYLPYLVLQTPEQLIQTFNSDCDAQHFVLLRTLLKHYSEAQRCIPPNVYAAHLASLERLPARYSQDIYRLIAFAHVRGHISAAEIDSLLMRLASTDGSGRSAVPVEESMQFGRLLEFCRAISLFLANDDRAGAARFCQVLGLNVSV
jgi:hypothetical protein